MAVLQREAKLSWPPAYQIRRSKRAKRLSLKLTMARGLEVVLPLRANEKLVPPLLEENRGWLEKNLPPYLNHPTREDPALLPTSLCLRSLNETWAIEYVEKPGRFSIQLWPNDELIITGPVKNTLACKKALTNWLKKRAGQYLRQQMQLISDEIELPFRSLSLRLQKSRWGSCSAEHDICLNYKLIFLPEEDVRYVIVHELCHTVHLDHSSRFWNLVGRFVPNHRILSKKVGRDQLSVPLWLD